MIQEHSSQNDKFLKFVCISDTHTETDDLVIPDGDVLIHCGDFSYTGKENEIKKFAKFISKLPHKYKIVIAGNHDITFDKFKYLALKPIFRLKYNLEDLDSIKDCLIKDTGIIYLEDSSVSIEGYNIFGSPWSPKYGQWAFMRNDENLIPMWEKIPTNTDILITHGPPKFFGDETCDNINAGSLTLLNEIQNRIKPSYHLFGHIHEGYGTYNDGVTTYINCSILNVDYMPVNSPVVFYLPRKQDKIESDKEKVKQHINSDFRSEEKTTEDNNEFEDQKINTI
jgi:Icc-related predicted phosphoesterase